MSGAINADNQLSLLFKQFQGVSQTALTADAQGSALFNTEKYSSLQGVFSDSIYAENVPRDLSDTLLDMDSDDINYPESQWNNNIWDQSIAAYPLSDASGTALPLTFYKKVYLAPVQGSNQMWWLPDTSNALLQTPTTNVLRDMIPWKYNDVNTSTYTQRVYYWNGSAWVAGAINNENSLGWVIDFPTGFVGAYLPTTTLAASPYNLTNVTQDDLSHNRLRISYISYTGTKGVSGGGGGGGGSGTLQVGTVDPSGVVQSQFDASAIYFDDTQFSVSEEPSGSGQARVLAGPGLMRIEDLSYYFFDVPDACESGVGELYNGTDISLSWSLPPQTQSALPYGLTTTYIDSSNLGVGPITKLPYFQELKIEYKDWAQANDPFTGWFDLSINNTTPSQTLLPPTLTHAEVGSGGNPGELLNSVGSGATPPFVTFVTTPLTPGGRYQFRVYLTNLGQESGIVDPIYGGSAPYNYLYIPGVSGEFITLGNFGGPTEPTSLQFQFTTSYDLLGIQGYNDNAIGADVSLNVPWLPSGTGPSQSVQLSFGLELMFGMDISGSVAPSSIQMLDARNTTDMSASFSSNFGYGNTFTLNQATLEASGIEWYPEHLYQATNFYMESNKGPPGGSGGVKAFFPGDASYVSVIPSRGNVSAQTSRLPGGSLATNLVGDAVLADAYPLAATTASELIEDIYFMSDTSSVSFTLSTAASLNGANNLDPADTTAWRGMDSVGEPLTFFSMDISASASALLYEASTNELVGYLDVSNASLITTHLQLDASAQEGSTVVPIERGAGYYTDVTINTMQLLDICLNAVPDICNNNYLKYTIDVADNYRDAAGSWTDGNAYSGELAVARTPLADTTYTLSNYTNPNVSLNFDFFGQKLPALGVLNNIDYSYNVGDLDPYWKPHLTLTTDTLTYAPSTGTELDIQQSSAAWTGNNVINPLFKVGSTTLWAINGQTDSRRYSRTVIPTSAAAGPQLEITSVVNNNVIRAPISVTYTQDVSFGTPGEFMWWDYTWESAPGGTGPSNMPTNFFSTLPSTDVSFTEVVGYAGGAGWANVGLYDHSVSLPYNQAMWANQAFRAGGTSGSNSPYIDFRQFYDPTSALLDYSALGASGETISLPFNNASNTQKFWDDASFSGTIGRVLKYFTLHVVMPYTNDILNQTGVSSTIYQYSLQLLDVAGSTINPDSDTGTTGNGYWVFHNESLAGSTYGPYIGQMTVGGIGYKGSYDITTGLPAGINFYRIVHPSAASSGAQTQLQISIGLPSNLALSVQSFEIVFWKK